MEFFENDLELWNAIDNEQKRQEGTIELIASENIVSPEVMAAQGSVLTNKYAEGYPAHRYYGGCEYIDKVENLAIERAKKLFNAEYTNVQPHSGSQANMAVYRTFLEKGDCVLGMDLNGGGHLTHGAKVNFSGQDYEFHSYGVSENDEKLDYEAILEQAKVIKPQMIVAGASAYSRAIDFKKFREIADAVDAILMVDMAHIAGLVAAGLHQNPVEYADVVTTTTHKTLRGPRGGMILARAEYGKRINSAVFPGIQGGPLEHVIAAKAVAFREALEPEFKDYAQQVIKNTAAMVAVFKKNPKAHVVSGGSDNHLFMVKVTDFGLNGKQVQDLLDSVQITLNKNSVPFETLSPFKTSGIRIGSAAITTRGFKEAEAAKVAELILAVLEQPEDEAVKAEVRAAVADLTAKNPTRNFGR